MRACGRKTAIFIISLLLLSGCVKLYPASAAAQYGVLIGANPDDMLLLPSYQTIVVDAAYFTKTEIEKLHQRVNKVYSYLNIGSIETFREVFPAFEDMILDPYDNWPGEFWMDVSRSEWQSYILGAAKALVAKGIDGFFIDNTDVYYQYRKQEIFQGLVTIINGLNQYGKDIVINGGDTFVSKAILDVETSLLTITGVNQECVFTAIDFDSYTLTSQEDETKEYFLEYLTRCKEAGINVYLTEYASADQKKIRRDIENYCNERGYVYYIASSLELDNTK